MSESTIIVTPPQAKTDFGLTLDKVVRVYNGQHGCMCGCRGTYSETSRSKTLAYNKLMKLPLIGVQFQMRTKDDIAQCEVLCIFNPNPKKTRSTVVYFSE